MLLCSYIVKKKNQMSTSVKWISILDNKYYSIQFNKQNKLNLYWPNLLEFSWRVTQTFA